MDSNNFPMMKKISAKLLADDIIGMRPGETSLSALNRHIQEKLLKERKLKIEKIKNRINDSRNKGTNY